MSRHRVALNSLYILSAVSCFVCAAVLYSSHRSDWGMVASAGVIGCGLFFVSLTVGEFP